MLAARHDDDDLRLTRKAEGSEFSENSPAKLDVSARAGSPTLDKQDRPFSLRLSLFSLQGFYGYLLKQ